MLRREFMAGLEPRSQARSRPMRTLPWCRKPSTTPRNDLPDEQAVRRQHDQGGSVAFNPISPRARLLRQGNPQCLVQFRGLEL
jgi:hypothetical protein